MIKIENDKTIMVSVVSRSNSIRTTASIHITRKLKLEFGDRVEWDLDKINGHILTALI